MAGATVSSQQLQDDFHCRDRGGKHYAGRLPVGVTTSSVDLLAVADFNTTVLSQTWCTATVKNDARIVARAASLHKELVDTVKGSIALDGDFRAYCLFQPLPEIFARQAGNSNALGLSRQRCNGLLVQTTLMVRTAAQKRMAYQKCREFMAALRDFARSTELDGMGNLSWEYINYADASENPLLSYGAENLRRLKEVAKRYDPGQVFQELCPVGFKLAHVHV